MDFSKKLIVWYLENKRDLPWRNTINPYPVWLSEIILQQTRVAQGLPYFELFLNAFPTVFDLAEASEEQILKLWQGLGYYSRARNLHQTAKIIASEYDGKFPTSYKELLLLKGIGSYTAAAIASFCFEEPVAVLDGNVFRVLSRYYGIETDISSPKGKTEFTALANEVMSRQHPSLYNQAIMEYGALQCIPKNPDCSVCVLKDSCVALQLKKVNELPMKLKKIKTTNRYFNYLIYEDEFQNSIIQKRTSKGIWYNLYEFPLLESESEIDLNQFTSRIKQCSVIENPILEIIEMNQESILHLLSHQKLFIKFWWIKTEGTLKDAISYSEIKKRPFPIVIYNFIEKYF
jgi:A/G-specific adenine glycosylase